MKQTLLLFLSALVVVVSLAFSTSSVQAQSIVVSEYYNVSAVPEREWTELLVIQDNLTIVGYTLRDNSTTLDNWQGGIRFKDVPLWKNLRAGTVIVVNHRIVSDNVLDKSPVDGYIEAEANDLTLFDTLTVPTGGIWINNSLNISQTADILQIRDAAGNHIHALSHGTNTGDYAALPQPKIQHPGTITGNVRVYPGASLSDYSGTGTKTFESTVNGTRGRPNRGATASDDLNSPFWRATRQPIWATPALTSSFIGTDVHLLWNAITDPNPADNIHGYMVLIVSELQPDTNAVPQDGKSYTVGSTIGDWRVLANITSSQTTVFDDIVTNIPCGVSYKYRVFAYRYSQDETDNAAMSGNPVYGRGRSYNETNFGTARIFKAAPAKPDITASGPLTFCLGKDITLSTASVAGITYQWSKNGTDIPNATQNTLLVNSAGQYRVWAISTNGCSTESDAKEVIIATAPSAQITASSLSLCEGDTVNLFASQADSYEWSKDGVTIPSETKQTLRATTVGSYRVIVRNSAGCADTSLPTTIKPRFVSFSFKNNVTILDFGKLNDCQSSIQKSVSVQNDTGEDIRIEAITPMVAFSLVSPPLPATIRNGQSLEFTFQFTPQTGGTTTDSADFVASPCSISRRLSFTGSKDLTKVVLSTTSVDFGTILSCENTGHDTTIYVRNNGTTNLVISGANFIPADGYDMLVDPTISLPVTLNPGVSLPLTVRFKPVADGSYFSQFKISYSMGVCNDTLRVNLQGFLTTPSFTTDIKNIDFAPLQACDSRRDTVIVLQNTGSIPLTINNQPTNPNVQFLNLPLVIPANQSTSLAVRFQPLSQGNFSGLNIPILADICNASHSITVNGSKQGTTFSLSNEEIDFGDITLCTPVQLQKTIQLAIDGSTSGTTVSSVRISKPFSINLADGQSVTDQQKIILSFTPDIAATGDFADSVRITFEPCGIVKYIKVHAKLLSKGYGVSSLTADFGTIDTGSTSSPQTVVLKNNGEAPLHILSIDGITAPFSLASATPQPPVTLATNETITVTLSYSPIKAGYDSITVKFVIDQPCDTVQMIQLTGTGIVKPPPPPDTIRTSATIQIADGTAAVGETVVFPITILSSDISLSKIYSMSVDVSYNPRLLMPKAVRGGSPQSGFTSTYTDIVPGQTRITVENPSGLNSTTFINSGILAELECEALLGDQISTPLSLSNETFSRIALSTTAVTQDAGVFTLSGDCALDSRKVLVGGAVTLLQKSVTKDYIELEFETVSEERTALILYSSIGTAIETITDAELKYGKHSAIVSVHSLSGGMYYVVLRTGTAVKVLPLCIEK